MDGGRARTAAISGLIACGLLAGGVVGLAAFAVADPGGVSVGNDRDTGSAGHPAANSPAHGPGVNSKPDGATSGTNRPEDSTRRGPKTSTGGRTGAEVSDPKDPERRGNLNADKDRVPSGQTPGGGVKNPAEGGTGPEPDPGTPPGTDGLGCDRTDDGHRSGCGPVGFWANLMARYGDGPAVAAGGGGPIDAQQSISLIRPTAPQPAAKPVIEHVPAAPVPPPAAIVPPLVIVLPALPVSVVGHPGGTAPSAISPPVPAGLPVPVQPPVREIVAESAVERVPDTFRAGYPGYLRAASFDEVAGVALAGVSGLFVLTAAGGLIGYRQAKAGLMTRSSGMARFLQ